MKRKTILIILIVLLLLCVGSIIWVYFFRNASQNEKGLDLSNTKYEFLNDFYQRKEDQKYIYQTKGIMYNQLISSDEANNKITFSLNTWNLKTKESKYYDNIDIEIDKINLIPENLLFNNAGLLPVEMLFKFSDTGLESVDIMRLTLSQNEYNEILKKLYGLITGANSKNINSVNSLPYSYVYKEGKNYTYGTIFHNEEAVYVPFVESNLRKSELKEKIGIKDEMDIDEYLKKYSTYLDANLNIAYEDMEPIEYGSMYKEYLNKLEKSVTKHTEDNIQLNPLQYKYWYPYSCTMVKNILDNVELEEDSKKILKEKFCNIEALNKYIYFARNYEGESYDTETITSHINYSNISEKQKFEDDYVRRYLISSLAETYVASDLYSENVLLEESKKELINKFISLYFTKDTFSFGDVCNLNYASEIAKKYSTTKRYEKYQESIVSMLRSDIFKTLTFLDKDIYSSILCLKGNDDEIFIRDLRDAILLKIYYLHTNLEEENGFDGVWENNLLQLTTNSEYFNILLDLYDEKF